MTEQQEIIAALEEERKLVQKPFRFVLERVETRKDTHRLTVDPKDQRSQLDESLDGRTVWWDHPERGYANVLSVLPEHSQLNLRFVSSRLPPPGDTISIQQPDFLSSLITLWEDDSLADQSISWLNELSKQRERTCTDVPSDEGFPFLRERQRQAFQLLQYTCSFLWGPPGTGKTTTLGCILASYINQFPDNRVLVLSMTNTAVDQALVGVDKGLEYLADTSMSATSARKSCRRIGLYFIPENYRDREHLLPVVDPQLIQQLSKLEASRPDPAIDNDAYAQWYDTLEALRQEIRQQSLEDFKNSQLHAMTAVRAVTDYELLREMRYDLVVFDEASQVGLSHALVLSRLGRAALFTGDFRQLAPIVQCDFPIAERWLAKSMFDYMEPKLSSTCILNEQNRMAEPICRIVSSMFYENQLKVAKECYADPEWHRVRELISIPGIGSKRIYIRTIHQEGIYASPGWYRIDSLDFICKTVHQLSRHQSQDEILVVTPFRAQRYRIRKRFREIGLGDVPVTTIHRAQGSEYHTVILDPVRGGSPWMMSTEGMRLINVAISRAKARLIITLSRGDRNNALLDLIAQYAQLGTP